MLCNDRRVSRAGWLAALLLSAMSAVAAPIAVPDDTQQTVRLSRPAERIISLAPGATAMLFAAGAGDRIVGTSAYSDEPEAARRIEQIGDAQGFDLERILALRPDVVVAWAGGTSAAQIERLKRAGLPLYYERVTRLADLPGSVERLGALAGTETVARSAGAALTTRLAALAGRTPHAAAGTVLIEVWDHPLYTVGGNELLSDVLTTCGYRNVFAELTQPGPAVTLESVLARNPDLVLALGSDAAQSTAWANAWKAYPALSAVRHGHLVPWSDARFSRLGPSMVEAAEDLCRALAPLGGRS